MGYHMAGFEVVGVDIEPQPSYPFKFIQMNVLDLNPEHIRKHFQAVAASPPCQVNTSLRRLHPEIEYDDLIPPTRELLKATGLPYVIENVPGAKLVNPVQMCGSAFGLRVRRHRLFEANFKVEGSGCDHEWQDRHRPYKVQISTKRAQGRVYGSQEERYRLSGCVPVHGGNQLLDADNLICAAVAMGIEWMTKEELNQAVPPAFTCLIGEQLMEQQGWR